MRKRLEKVYTVIYDCVGFKEDIEIDVKERMAFELNRRFMIS